MGLDVSELRGPVSGDKEVKLSFFSSYFGDVEVEEANRIGFERLFTGLVDFPIRMCDEVERNLAYEAWAKV